MIAVVGVVAANRLAEPWLRAKLVSTLAAKAASDLDIDTLDVRWRPLGVSADGVSMTLDDEQEPYLMADRVTASIGLRELIGGRLRVDQVVIDQPVLAITVREDGSLALPNFEGGGEKSNRFEIAGVELRQGEVRWSDGRVPLEANLEGLTVESSISATDGSHATLAADALTLTVAGEPLIFEMQGEVDWRGSTVERIHLTVEQKQADIDVLGSWIDGAGEFEVAASGDLEVVQPWLEGISGHVSLEARVSNTDPRAPMRWVVAGEAEGSQVRVAQFQLAEIPLQFELMDGTVTIDSDNVVAYGGIWQPRLVIDGTESRLQVRGGGVSLAGLAEDLGWEQLARGGRISGAVDYRFAQADWRNGRGEGRVEVAAGQEWRLSGAAPLKIEPGLEIEFTGALADQWSTVDIGGAVDATDGAADLSFAIRTADLTNLQQQLGLSGDFLPKQGAGSVTGSLRSPGDGGAPQLAVQADLQDVWLASLEADRAVAEMTLAAYGVTLHSAELYRHGSNDSGDASSLTAAGAFPSDGRSLELEASARSWPLMQILPLASIDLPVAGLASGTVSLVGSRAADDQMSIAGEIDVTLDGPAYGDMALGGSIHAPVLLSSGQIEVTDGSWATEHGNLTFGASVRGTTDWQLKLSGEDLHARELLPQLSLLGDDYRVGGTISLTGGEGIESGQVELVTRQGGEAAPAVLVGGLDADQLSLTGEVAGVLHEVELTGQVSPDGPRFHIDGLLEVADWIALTEPEVHGSGRLSIDAMGSWDQPEVTAELTSLDVYVAEERLREVEPVRVVLRDNVIELESGYLQHARTGGELFVAGAVDLDSQAIEGVIQADLDATWLGTVVPELRVQGGVSYLGVVEGTIDDPVVDGQGQWADGVAQIEGFPHTFEAVNVRFLVGRAGVVVDKASADLSGGRLAATGHLDFDEETGYEYSIRLAASEINVNFPEDWWIGGDATLRIIGDAESRRVSGDVRLRRAVLLQSVDLSVEQILRSAFAKQREWVPSSDPLLRSTRLQLQVVGENALQVTGEGLDLSGDIDLSLGGDLASPLILGRVDLSAGGEIVFRGNEFAIERGLLVFDNPHVIDPEIDLVALADVRSYDVRLHLLGTLAAMDIKFTSDPSLPSLEVVSLLTTGQVGSQPLLLEPVRANESAAAEGLLAGQAAEAVGSRVGKLFGLDRVQVDPLTESSGSLSSARVTVAKRLSERLVATYSYDPTDSEEQLVQIDWQVTPDVAAILTQNGDGSYAIDFKWHKSF